MLMAIQATGRCKIHMALAGAIMALSKLHWKVLLAKVSAGLIIMELNGSIGTDPRIKTDFFDFI